MSELTQNTQKSIVDLSKNRKDKANTFQTAVNLSKVIFGFATFTLPSYTLKSGFVLSFIAYLVGSILMISSVMILGETEDMIRKRKKIRDRLSYATLSGRILGKAGEIIVHIAIVLTVTFAVSWYMKSIGIMGQRVIQGDSGSSDKGKSVSRLCSVLALVLVFALSYINSPRLMSFANIFGMGAVFACLVVVVLTGFLDRKEFSDKLKATSGGINETNDLFSCIIILLSLHLVAVDFRQDIIDPKKNFNKAISVSTLFASFLNFIYATIVCYLYFKRLKDLGEDGILVINCISKKRTLFFAISSFMISTSLCFSSMILSRVAIKHLKEIVSSIFSKNKKDSEKSKELSLGSEAIMKIIFFGVIGLISCFAENLSIFNNILGAILFPTLAFIIPSVLLFKMKKFGGSFWDTGRIFAFGILGMLQLIFGVINSAKEIGDVMKKK